MRGKRRSTPAGGDVPGKVTEARPQHRERPQVDRVSLSPRACFGWNPHVRYVPRCSVDLRPAMVAAAAEHGRRVSGRACAEVKPRPISGLRSMPRMTCTPASVGPASSVDFFVDLGDVRRGQHGVYTPEDLGDGRGLTDFGPRLLVIGNRGPPLHGNHGPVRSEDPSIDGQGWEAGLHGSFLQVPEMPRQAAATWFWSIGAPDYNHPNPALSADAAPTTKQAGPTTTTPGAASSIWSRMRSIWRWIRSLTMSDSTGDGRSLARAPSRSSASVPQTGPFGGGPKGGSGIWANIRYDQASMKSMTKRKSFW